MRVLIIHDEIPRDAREDELDVLAQASLVRSALESLGHESDMMPVGLDLGRLTDRIRSDRPGLVFNLVESIDRSCRLAPSAAAVLESLGVPFTGSGSGAMMVTNGKLMTKRILAAHGIPTPAWIGPKSLRTAPTMQPGAWIVKSAWEHASVGIDDGAVIIDHDGASLASRARARAQLIGGVAFAERFIDGREFNVALLADAAAVRTLPVCEICFEDFTPDRPRIVGYAAKWDDGSFEYAHTPRRYDFDDHDRPLLAELIELSRACWERFDLRGYARVDFRVGQSPTVLEINTNPCLSPDAGFMAAAQRAGLTPKDVIAGIVQSAVAATGA